jgi:predicted O-methyltransferase YrrM
MAQVPDRESGLNEGAVESCEDEFVRLRQNQTLVGKTGRVFEDGGSALTEQNSRTIRKLLWENRAERTLEVGFCLGGSALLFCSAHRMSGRSPNSQHTAIDPYQTTTWDSCGLIAVEKAGLTGYLDFREAFSAIELPKLFEAGTRFGLAYIDGSHIFEDVFVDSYFVTRLLSEGGVVLFDDSSNPHVKKVIRFVRTNLHAVLPELDLSLYRNTSKRFTYRLARYFGKIQLTAFRRVGDVERCWDAPFRGF